MFCFFFFQAEDGIRDGHVTGVQTCALPISSGASSSSSPESRPHPIPSAAAAAARSSTPTTSALERRAWYGVEFIIQIGRASCREREKEKAVALLCSKQEEERAIEVTGVEMM